MANMCSNILDAYNFQDEGLKKDFFLYLERAKVAVKGTLPLVTTEEDPKNGYKVPDSWFFDVSPDYSIESDSVCINFESKWAPPIKTTVLIAQKFKFDFDLEYEEGSSIYGRYKYNLNGDELWQKDLEDEYLNENQDSMDFFEGCDIELDKMSYELVNICDQ